MNYWKQKANFWVSLSVLAGGLVAACLLFVIFRVEADFQTMNYALDEELISHLETKSR